MNKETNDQIYQALMQLRMNEPKRYVLVRIREKYETIVSRINKHGKDGEVRFLTNDLSDYIKRMCPKNGISKDELLDYFHSNGMSLTF